MHTELQPREAMEIHGSHTDRLPDPMTQFERALDTLRSALLPTKIIRGIVDGAIADLNAKVEDLRAEVTRMTANIEWAKTCAENADDRAVEAMKLANERTNDLDLRIDEVHNNACHLVWDERDARRRLQDAHKAMLRSIIQAMSEDRLA